LDTILGVYPNKSIFDKYSILILSCPDLSGNRINELKIEVDKLENEINYSNCKISEIIDLTDFFCNVAMKKEGDYDKRKQKA
jgi:hypothetical protein